MSIVHIWYTTAASGAANKLEIEGIKWVGSAPTFEEGANKENFVTLIIKGAKASEPYGIDAPSCDSWRAGSRGSHIGHRRAIGAASGWRIGSGRSWRQHSQILWCDCRYGRGLYRTFFVDFAGGSESNSGTSEASPWKRAPGMQGFEHAYTPQAGDHFIFKGGVTWPNSVFPLNATGEGTSSAEDVYGVNESWFSGSSYTRPVFDAEGKEIGGHDGNDNFFINLSAGGAHRNWITIEGIHFRGFNAENPNGGYGTCAGIWSYDGLHNRFNNIVFNEFPAGDFIEPWANGANKTTEEPRCVAIGDSQESGYVGQNESAVENSSIEGLTPAEAEALTKTSGEPGGNFFEGIRSIPIVKNTLITRMTQGYFPPEGGGVIAGNRFEDCGYPDFPAKYRGNLHANMIEAISGGLHAGDYSRPFYIYNNVIRGTGSSGARGGTAECEVASMEGGVFYLWNNVVTKSEGNPILFESPMGLSGSEDKGKFFVWNNSLEGDGLGGAGGACLRSAYEWLEIQVKNNFCATGGSKFSELPLKAKTLEEDNQLILAPSELATHGYAGNEAPHAYEPASIGASGVGKGSNLTTLCAGPVASLCTDSTYGGVRTTVARPSGGNWDIGAYDW